MKKIKLTSDIVFITNFQRTIKNLTLITCLMFASINAFSAGPITITPSSVLGSQIIFPFGLNFTDYEIAYGSCSTSNTGDLMAVAFDGADAGLIVTDGTLAAYYPFSSISWTTGSPTVFTHPDLVISRDGTRVIVTFDTDDVTYGAFYAEFRVNTTSSAITIFQNILKEPVNWSTYTWNPRIDVDPTLDRFSIVYIENNFFGSDQAFFNIFEPFGVYYSIYGGGFYFEVPASANTPSSGDEQFFPDIALNHDGGNVASIVVSYKEYNYGNNDVYLKVDETLSYPWTTTNLVNVATGVGAYSPNLCGYPHIAGDNATGGIGGTGGSVNMKWALSSSELSNAFSTGPSHLWYMNSVNAPTYIKIDDPYSSAPNPDYRNFTPSLDWMTGNDDAFVAWNTAENINLTPTVFYTVGVMLPFINNVGYSSAPWYYNTWEQYDDSAGGYGPDVNSTTSVCSDAGLQRYVTSYSATSAGIQIINYKVRGIPNTGF